MHLTAVVLLLVTLCEQIQDIFSERNRDDYLDYDSDEDIFADHASSGEPSYIREIRKYRKLGIDYDLRPAPIPVYYPVHVPKPYYTKKHNYYDDYKPYKYSKSTPDYGKGSRSEETPDTPSNETESSAPSKLASRESNYRSRAHDEYSRPFALKSRVVDYHPHPIPFKDLDPEFTTTIPPPPSPPPPQRRRLSTPSPPSPKRTSSNTKVSPKRIEYRKEKSPEYIKPRPPTEKAANAGENSPRTQYRHKNRESTRSPPRRYQQHTPADSEDDRTYQSPNQERSRPHSTDVKPRTSKPRQYKQKSYSDRENKPSDYNRQQSPSHKKPPVSRHRSETTSEEPRYQRKDEMATKLGFGKYKGSFSDLVKDDNPFDSENNEKRKHSSTKPIPKTQPRRNEKKYEEDRASSVRSSPDRDTRTKVYYDDDAERESYPPPKQIHNKAYKKHDDRTPSEHSEHNQHSRNQNYTPNKYHSSTPSTRSEPYYQSSHSSPVSKGKQKEPRERSYEERPSRDEKRYEERPSRDEKRYEERPSRDEKSYEERPSRDEKSYEERPSRDEKRYEERPSRDDRPTSTTSSEEDDDADADDDRRKEKLIPRRYVPTKRHYDREDRREPESAEEPSEEDSSREEELEAPAPKKRYRNKRHSTKPRSWERVVEESRVTTISSSNPSVLKIFKAMKIGKSNEDVVLFDTRVTKDKRGQIRQILTKSIPLFLKANKSDIPNCSRGNSLDYCTIDSEYPRENVLGVIQKNPDQLKALLNLHPGAESVQRRFIVQNGNVSDGCSSINSWILPLRSKDVNGIWRVIVNVDEFKQSVNLEICSKQNEACNTSQNSICKQQNVDRHLVTLTKSNELSVGHFKFPSYCSCST